MKGLLRLLSYPLSVLFYLLFGIYLLVFDVIQRICLNIFGYQAHKVSVDYFNWFLFRTLHILGTSYKISLPDDLPKGVPVIIASNHQSMWDIPPIIWFLRKLHPKFISKIELGKGIPSVSYNLKHGGSVLIDRKDPEQALAELEKFARYLSETNRSGVIFPEGTRSRDGHPKKFHRKGLRTLFKNIPEAWVLPVTINNSWKLQRNGMFPIPLGTRFQLKAHAPLKVSEYDTETLISRIEEIVTSHIVEP